MKSEPATEAAPTMGHDDFRNAVLEDYKVANLSRQASLLGRKEVLTGKAKFGIFGDGKEVAQLAMARAFRPGDWRAGYYRDQTFMMASGLLTVQQFFAQLYAHPDVDADPSSAGRSMNGHFSTATIGADGKWLDLTARKNSSSDISPTAGQMPRLLGLALASKLYRNNSGLSGRDHSVKGNEVAFGTIGDASTSEGHFWETMNAASVLGVPMLMSVWDDGYGISVPRRFQTVKGSISEALRGFEAEDGSNGIRIFKAKGWDYPNLVQTYAEAAAYCRKNHMPVLMHVEEVTQPQGHSTSGSHERYKSKERLEWEAEYDGIRQMRLWMIATGIATAEELDAIENEAKNQVRDEKNAAWESFNKEIKGEIQGLIRILDEASVKSSQRDEIQSIVDGLKKAIDPLRKEMMQAARRANLAMANDAADARAPLSAWLKAKAAEHHDRFSSYLLNEGPGSAMKVSSVAPEYATDAPMVDGRELLLRNFEVIFERMPEVLAFGEDVGGIGGVNQTYEGMQKRFGELRVSDTGIREATIIGQGIGLALRGLRPIAEIQYLDYLLYGLQPLSDDLATLCYRTKGQQKAPLIVSTRGHRLEGIWHSGSPMGMVINALRGMHICVPRNLTTAAGFYNTLLASDDPGMIIEPLNAYRSKERLPSNLGDFRLPLGVPEILSTGTDLTLVSYGSTTNICLQALPLLQKAGISAELIDCRTLLPFDVNGMIAQSVKKTSRLLVVDEDVPGGASAFILQQVVQEQGAYRYMDSEPMTLTAKAHRPAYGTDGDYFSKPGVEDVTEAAYAMMAEAQPRRFPAL
jgi:pyruvate/2-oxoglutarate/acetoin dehydrogenase E1 component/TPP-dependent pyruvate/acetoin dehydrogenase alpha subunit